MATHDLKTWPGPFQAIVDRKKTHEIRNDDDRDYEAGDELLLREWVPDRLAGMPNHLGAGSYTGRELRVHVTYVTHGGEWGLPVDLCVMSIAPVDKE